MLRRDEGWDAAPVLEAAARQFVLSPHSIHGPSHWMRVTRVGLHLAEETGADPLVVRLFGALHDARRINDRTDPDHGLRGAQLAAELRGALYELEDERFALLREACELHSDGLVSRDPTIGTCWDADRLELIRLGIRPHDALLSTAAARRPDALRFAQRLWHADAARDGLRVRAI
jgi:uncharacterized protein